MIKTALCAAVTLLGINLSTCADTPPHNHLASVVGPAITDTLEQAESVFVQKVTPNRKPPYPALSDQKALDAEQVSALRTLLLNDTSYRFDIKKRCLFIPEDAYIFKGKKEVNVYVSEYCQQIKVVMDKTAITLDYDPVAKQLNQFNHDISHNLKTSMNLEGSPND